MLPVVEAGLKVAVTARRQAGGAERHAADVKPPVRAIVIVLVPLPRAPPSGVRGWRPSEKSGAFTVSPIGVVRVSPPPVPVTVTVAGPAAAVRGRGQCQRRLLVPVVGGRAEARGHTGRQTARAQRHAAREPSGARDA